MAYFRHRAREAAGEPAISPWAGAPRISGLHRVPLVDAALRAVARTASRRTAGHGTAVGLRALSYPRG
ncbi:hypothetical protein QFZ74_002168 [Streptomyces sp. V3I7]|nr:hypothetical protein [Streptomyces sp. V3I7]